MQRLHEVVNPIATPQTERIPGRTDQTKNDAGGYGWTASSLSQLHRFLVLGSEGGTYYATERELTLQSYAALTACLANQPKEAIELIAQVSESGRAPKNDPALFALAVAASHENPDVRALAYAALPRVARIGTHLFHFVEYLTARKARRRGWGPSLRKAIARWYNEREPLNLAHQLEKYRSRDGWSHRDLLRLAHPTPPTFDHSWLYARVVGKPPRTEGLPSMEVSDWTAAVSMLSSEGATPGYIASQVSKYRLPREVLPTEALNSPEVWAALLEHMPVTAMVRNLATMTRIGLIAPMSDATRSIVAKLADGDVIRKSRIHPMQILLALWTYRGGQSGQAGRGFGREVKTWTPEGRIIDALDSAFYAAFANVEPTGKRTLLAIDGSGSMRGGYGTGPFAAANVAAAMAMVTARTEPEWSALLYDQNVYPFPALTPKARLDQLIQAMPGHGCGTDGALPFQWALKAKVPVDIFLSYTDGQTWAGNQHPAQALQAYRQAMGIEARAVQVQIVNNAVSNSDPRDPLMLDVVGFDASVPEVLAGFARGEF